MTLTYKTRWSPNQLNELFWEEVLLGRTINKLEWDAEGLAALILDNGERVAVGGEGRVMIECQIEET